MVLVATLLVVLASCGGSSSNGQPVDARLAAAKTGFDDARFIGFTLSSDNLPGGVSALESAHGTGTHAPAFTGEVQIVKGLSFTAPLVAINGTVYAKLPFVSWSEINPADYGAPDPAALMDKTTGLSSLLTDTIDPTSDGSERSGSTVLTKIDGTLPGKYVHALFPSSAASDFKVTFTLTDDNDLHSVSITGPFYGEHGDSTYSIVLDLSADPVTIAPPQ
jgi:lipoprotein LprG